MRRPTVARGGLVAFIATVVLACGSATPTTTPSGSGPSSSQPNATVRPTAVPLPSATILSTAVRPCAYVPGAPVVDIPPHVVKPVPVPSPPAATKVDAATTRRQLEVLNDLWRVVDRNYVDPTQTGSEWDAVRTRYRQIVQAGLTDEDFRYVANLMVYELGDDHSFVESPEEVAERDAELEGENDYAGIGALLAGVEDRDALVVSLTRPGSPAERAGIRPHDVITAVDGQLPIDADGVMRTDLIRGPVGTSVTLTVERPGEEPRDIVVVRDRITGPTPVDVCMIPNTRVLYVNVVTLFDRTIDDQVRAALEKVAPEGPLDGLVLDNRLNDGGASSVLRSMLSFFVAGDVGELRSPSDSRRMVIEPVDIAGSQKIPLVVLVGLGTASYGEVLSGVLQAEGRAKVVGDTTDGNVETLHGYDLANGWRAWIALETFEATRATYGPWEDTGIVPDRIVPSRWDLFNEANDPALPVALELLGLP